MAVIQMPVAPCNDVGNGNFAFEFTQALAAAGDTDIVLIPESVKNMTITLQGAGGANATLYYTTDLVSLVKSGVGVTWVASATLSGETTAVCEAALITTAIKMTQANAGTSKIAVRAQ